MASKWINPADIVVCDCFGRDGLQNFTTFVDTDVKICLINGLIWAGLPKVEVTSFVPPKNIPQFADAEEVLAHVERSTGARLVGFVPNARGMQRAADLTARGIGISDALIVVSASESHNKKNLNRTRDETCAEHREAARIAHDAGIGIIGSISTAFGCPMEGPTPADAVWRLIDHYLEIGSAEVQFGDTTGEANPNLVYHFFAEVFRRYPGLAAIAHFHDVRGVAMVNTVASIEAGVRLVDTSLGGTGGRPHYQKHQHIGQTGNLCSEDFVALCSQVGYETGIDPEALIEVGRLAEIELTEPLWAHVTHSGVVERQRQKV